MKALVFMNQNVRTSAGRKKPCIVVQVGKRQFNVRAVEYLGLTRIVAQERATKQIATHHVHAWVEVEADDIQVVYHGRWRWLSRLV